MLTVNDAYKIVRKKGRKYLYKVDRVLDFGDFYLFFIIPFYVKEKEGERYNVGTHFPRVNKRTGKYDMYDITDDVDAYLNAKEVKVEDIFMKKVKKQVVTNGTFQYRGSKVLRGIPG